MHAATIVQPGQIEIRDVAKPTPGAGEVRVRIEGCGVCASNIPPWEGREWFKYPMEPGQLGHEAWGVIDEVGSGVSSFKPGTRVAFLANHSYAEFDIAPVSNVVKIPASLDGHPFPGEPLGCAINIFRRSQVKKGDTVANIGVVVLRQLAPALAGRVGPGGWLALSGLLEHQWAEVVDIITQRGAADDGVDGGFTVDEVLREDGWDTPILVRAQPPTERASDDG